MKTRTILFVLLIMFVSRLSFGQASASFIASTADLKIGIGYDFSSKAWGEVRINGMTGHRQVSPEAMLFYNFVNTEGHNFYIGVGGAPVRDYYFALPVGLKVNTSTVLKNTSLHLEIQPTFEGDSFDPSLYCSVGFRYFFGQKN